jgi:hypothetical protein
MREMDPLCMRQPILPFTWVGASQLPTTVVLLLCSLKKYSIIDSALFGGRFLIINLIEQGYLLVARYPMIF